jgi:uncharacterized protein YbjT (DUF2867 family)
MPQLITITGATGKVGGALAGQLLQSGVKIRAVARNADRLAPLARSGAEVCAGDLEDTPFLAESFRGADAVFAILPDQFGATDFKVTQRRIGTSLAKALRTAGVRRAVVLSSIGADLPSGTGPIAGLHEFEELLKALPGLSVVAVRSAYYMENFFSSIPMIKNGGINGSAIRADVTLPMSSTRDVAALAAGYLRVPTFKGFSVHDVLGPRDYTFREATTIIGTAIGKPDLPYVEFSYEDFRKGLLTAGVSASMADVLVDSSRAFNEGRIQRTVKRTPANTTPTTLESFARESFAPAFTSS